MPLKHTSQKRIRLYMGILLVVMVSLLLIISLASDNFRIGQSSESAKKDSLGRVDKKEHSAVKVSNSSDTLMNNMSQIPLNSKNEKLVQDQMEEVDGMLEDLVLPEMEDRINRILLELKYLPEIKKRNKIFLAQDEAIKTYPSYVGVRDGLFREIEEDMDIEHATNPELVQAALMLRQQYWDAGGDLSKSAYVWAYKARILLEIAHEREPHDLNIIDELIETIQSTTANAFYEEDGKKRIANTGWYDRILELRTSQYAQICREVAEGRSPRLQDLVCGSDLVCMLARKDKVQARAILNWLSDHAERGGWAPYEKFISRARDKWLDDEKYNVYWPIYDDMPQENDPYAGFRNCRRLPSYRGFNEAKLPLRYRWEGDIESLPDYVDKKRYGEDS